VSTSAGGILVFLLLAVGLPSATVALARALSGAVAPAGRGPAAPPPIPSWVRFSPRTFLGVLLLVMVDVVALVVAVWAVALHLLDTGYALAELLLFAALAAGAVAYGWARGVAASAGDSD
jgi:NADH:ubiquinone oxidoreductase subunit 3 (subunit A)